MGTINLSIIWDALESARGAALLDDSQWDDICTEMAWVSEEISQETLSGDTIAASLKARGFRLGACNCDDHLWHIYIVGDSYAENSTCLLYDNETGTVQLFCSVDGDSRSETLCTINSFLAGK